MREPSCGEPGSERQGSVASSPRQRVPRWTTWGRVIVEPDCTVVGHPEIFVIGDLAHFRVGDGRSLPGIAPVAMQQGRHVSRVLERRRRGLPSKPFAYVDRGMMATIGRAAAVADIRGFRFSGYLAWLAWLFIHVLFLIEFQNRILVMMQWFWNYVTWSRSSRLITWPRDKSPGKRES